MSEDTPERENAKETPVSEAPPAASASETDVAPASVAGDVVEPTAADERAAEAASDVLLEADDEAEGVETATTTEEAVAVEIPAEEPAPARRPRRRRGAAAAEPASPPAPAPARTRRRERPPGPAPAVRPPARAVRPSARKAPLVCANLRGTGVVAGRAIPSPVPYADVVTFTTHKVLRGPRGGMLVSKAEHAKALDKAVFPFLQGGPLMHAVAGKAVALAEAATPEYQEYARTVIANAQALASGLESHGMRAVSGGTDTHLALIDLQPLGVTGKEAEARSGLAGITLNKNAIPYDPQPPMTASGIRVGSPAVTTRGFTPVDMRDVARLVARTLKHIGDDAVYEEVRTGVKALTARFPVPGIG